MNLTVEDIACSALAAVNASEISACYLAAEGYGYADLTSHILRHPLTGQHTTLGHIIADSYLNLKDPE